jgi:hypothetical protein
VIANASDAAVIGDDAAAVDFYQAPDELFDGLSHERLLSEFGRYRPQTLLSLAMLRKQARPVLRAQIDLCAIVGPPECSRTLARHQRSMALPVRSMMPA